MSFKVYQSLAQSAVLNFQRGQYRDSANDYLKAATSASPETWAENRWQIFTGYTSILTEKYFKPSQSDFEALEKLIKDESEGNLFRCEAAFVLGLLTWDFGDRSKAATLYREAIRLGEATSAKERQRKVLSSNNLSVEMRLVGAIVDETLERTRVNLKILEGLYGGIPPAEYQKRSDGSEIPNDIRLTTFPVGPNPTKLSKKEIDHLLRVGGAECDNCGKGREELGMSHLKPCERCMLAFYCSSECQETRFKEGHQAACRKPGQVENGDFVKLKDLVKMPELNGTIVQVVKPIDNQPGRVEVKIEGGEKSISVSREKLEQLRPLI